jgi:hypothetical protein
MGYLSHIPNIYDKGILNRLNCLPAPLLGIVNLKPRHHALPPTTPPLPSKRIAGSRTEKRVRYLVRGLKEHLTTSRCQRDAWIDGSVQKQNLRRNEIEE